MRNIFDDILEELQRRQAEQDAKREGRPVPPRARRVNGGPGGPRSPGGPNDGAPAGGRFGDFARFGRPLRIVTILAVLFLLFLLLGGVAGFATDVMWYSELGLEDVYLTRLAAQVGFFALGVALFAVPAAASVIIARRLGRGAPVRRIAEFEIPDLSRAAVVAVTVMGAIVALGFGGAWSGRWESVLLFLNAGDFGITDPHFGRDVGFYVFELPFLRFLQGWAMGALIAILILTGAVYAAGGTRSQFHLTAPVRAHLSVLGALILITFAVGYQLDIYELSYSTRGVGGAMQAASYTDLNAQQPALVFLTFVALASAVLLVANIWFKTLWLLVIAVGVWIGASIIALGLIPSGVQRFQVEPNELAVERPYIQAHIGATRSAFGLDRIDERPFTGQEPLTRELFEAEEETLRNARLWDYRPLLTTFGQQQILRQYYGFNDVDIDRYEIDGEQRQVMLSAREMHPENLNETARTWTNERLVFTHGYGITAVPVDAVTPEGQPDYLVSGIDADPDLPVGEPRIYFGESTDSYVIVGTATEEFDYPLEDREVTTSWAGETGVGLANPLTKLLFALRMGDMNLLISNQLTDDSQILFRRQLRDRVTEIAPFLHYDDDPYLVSAGGRLSWVWDAYTTTDRYPNAQPLHGEVLRGANYARNSVKVVVDAYDGSVRFFVSDPADPIIGAYQAIFPSMFEPLDAMPDELRTHLRYPEGMFRAQTEAYVLYHVEPSERGASVFYNKDDVWSVPGQQTGVDTGGLEMEPYYVIMRIPGEEAAEFVLIQPLAAASRPNMIAWVAARNDPEHYGELVSFRFPSDTSTLGPEQIQARIDQDPTISAQFTLWNQSGSDVVRGNLLVIPMGDSILYLEPIYLESTQSSFPEFRRVILASQTRIAFAETLEEGLRQLLGEAPLPPLEGGEEEPEPDPDEGEGDGDGDGDGELPEDVAGLVAAAQELYAEAEEALADGDLATYEERLEELKRVLDRLAGLIDVPVASPGASPAPSPAGSPNGSPAASPAP